MGQLDMRTEWTASSQCSVSIVPPIVWLDLMVDDASSSDVLDGIWPTERACGLVQYVNSNHSLVTTAVFISGNVEMDHQGPLGAKRTREPCAGPDRRQSRPSPMSTVALVS